MLQRANSAAAAARTRRERVAELISDEARPVTSCMPAHGILAHVRGGHLALARHAFETRQFKSMSSSPARIVRSIRAADRAPRPDTLSAAAPPTPPAAPSTPAPAHGILAHVRGGHLAL